MGVVEAVVDAVTPGFVLLVALVLLGPVSLAVLVVLAQLPEQADSPLSGWIEGRASAGYLGPVLPFAGKRCRGEMAQVLLWAVAALGESLPRSMFLTGR